MLQILISIFAFLISFTSMATTAYRAPNTDYKRAAAYHISLFNLSAQPSAFDSKIQFGEDLEYEIPQHFENFEELKKTFEYIRDTRFLEHEEDYRRPSWLYPADGCWVRAEVSSRHLLETKGIQLQKVFVFGNLEVQTPYSASGSVTWWYHVAPITRVGSQVYVIDPSIEAKAPLTLKEWLDRQNQENEALEISVCSMSTFYPSDDCVASDSQQGVSIEGALRLQSRYLNFEKELLIDLDLPYEELLGDSPPWL